MAVSHDPSTRRAEVRWRLTESSGLYSYIVHVFRFSDSKLKGVDLRCIFQDTVKRTLDELVEEHNAAIPLARLPAELLAEVFGFVPIRTRTDLGLVCKLWKDVLFGQPAIWDNIVFMPEEWTSGVQLSKILRFSAQSPLHLAIHFDPETYADSSLALASNLHRCITLWLRVGDDLPGDAAQALTKALCTRAPMLRKFIFLDSETPWRDSDLEMARSPLLGGPDGAPLLRLVKMHCDAHSIRWTWDAFKDVKEVMFSSVFWFQRRDVARLFELFPKVEQLGIQVHDWATSEADSSDAGLDVTSSCDAVTLPRQLKALVVISNALTADVQRLLRSMRWSRIPSVWISYNEGAISDEDGPLLQVFCDQRTDVPFIVRSMSLESSTFSDHSLNLYLYDRDLPLHQPVEEPSAKQMIDDDLPTGVTERAVLDIGHNCYLDPSIFASVQRLDLTEMAFDPEVVGSPMPMMPALVHLTIFTLKATSHTKGHMYSAFVATAPRGHTTRGSPRILLCPILETVRIAGRVRESADTPVTRLAPESVIALIETHLQYDAGKLQLLEFLGVELVVIDPFALHLLESLSLETTFDPRHVAYQFRSQELIHWN